MNDAANAGFTLNITAEFEDVDSYGIVHHTKLVAYLERARVRFITRLGFDINGSDAVPVLYDMRLHFRKPARFMDALQVHVRPVAFDGFRLTLQCRIQRDGDTLLRAKTEIVFFDRQQQRAVEAPDAFQEAFERWKP